MTMLSRALAAEGVTYITGSTLLAPATPAVKDYLASRERLAVGSPIRKLLSVRMLRYQNRAVVARAEKLNSGLRCG